MSLKKILAGTGLAMAAMSGTAHADPVGQVSDLAEQAGISTLKNTGGGIDVNYVPREGSELLP
ncbi:hypothetical protein Lesp02_48220 [Lentzea sp. NBRC 105346]|uniref:hypothetical protein n=1 Tax=Lentzea sp. NBRC 105346 TaxID=3032205 RepID=UPI0024A4A8C6|nr:hypothetical protein [Lentzea sp. NBRC 105346]GLZ32634.1 hypothetical protein Lesp02_48220 [Lentzea sp. NBRC 105346]